MIPTGDCWVPISVSAAGAGLTPVPPPGGDRLMWVNGSWLSVPPGVGTQHQEWGGPPKGPVVPVHFGSPGVGTPGDGIDWYEPSSGVLKSHDDGSGSWITAPIPTHAVLVDLASGRTVELSGGRRSSGSARTFLHRFHGDGVLDTWTFRHSGSFSVVAVVTAPGGSPAVSSKDADIVSDQSSVIVRFRRPPVRGSSYEVHIFQV